MVPPISAPAGIRSRDAAGSVAALVPRCGPMLHAVVRRLLRNPSDADDVVQETFLSAHRHWHRFRGEADPCTWLHAIAVRAAMRRGKRETRRGKAARDYARALPFMHARLARADLPDGSQEARELRNEARHRVDRALAQVAEPFRSALTLKEIAGMSVEQAARVLGVKAATVKTRLHRGRLLLRAALLTGRPTHAVPPPAYDRTTCMTLLRAKMDSLDRGEDFPVQDELVCERCREVFASLDVGHDACRSLRGRTMPTRLRQDILRALRQLDG